MATNSKKIGKRQRRCQLNYFSLLYIYIRTYLYMNHFSLYIYKYIYTYIFFFEPCAFLWSVVAVNILDVKLEYLHS